MTSIPDMSIERVNQILGLTQDFIVLRLLYDDTQQKQKFRNLFENRNSYLFCFIVLSLFVFFGVHVPFSPCEHLERYENLEKKYFPSLIMFADISR